MGAREGPGLDTIVYSHGVVPWIECHRINELRVDSWREGALWSGRFDSAQRDANTDTSDDYASIGTATLGCTGDGLAMWVQDATSIAIAGDLRGAVHVPQLASNATLSIGGGLAGIGGSDAATTDTCGCLSPDICEPVNAVSNQPLPSQPSDAVSPRETGRRAAALVAIESNLAGGLSVGAIGQGAEVVIGYSLPSGGHINIGNPRGLQGSVVINAANDGGSWVIGGSITVGSVSLSPRPAYSGSSLAYGGGVVGVVPFQQYKDDAFPPKFFVGVTPVFPAIRSVDAASAGALRLRFYGSVAPPAGGTLADALCVLHRTSAEGATLEVFEVSSGWAFDLASVPFNAARTELQVRWAPTTEGAPTVPAAGVYKLVHATAVGSPPVELAALACAGLPAASVPFFDWQFGVSVGVSGTQCYSTDLDYNRDSVVNPDDLGDFISDYYTEPPMEGPGGYAIPCPSNAPPYDNGYRAGFVLLGVGQCEPPFSDNLGDWITAYFGDC